MKKFYKKFSSKKELVETLISISKGKLDGEATLERNLKASRNRYFLIDKDGKTRCCDNFKKFFFMFNHITGHKIYHKLCHGNGHTFHVFTQEDIFSVGGKGGTLSGLPEKAPVETVKVVEPEETKVDVEVVETLVVEPSEEVKAVDFAKYEAINDGKLGKRDAKNALEAAVKEDLGIDLNKKATFEGMMDELREILVARETA